MRMGPWLESLRKEWAMAWGEIEPVSDGGNFAKPHAQWCGRSAATNYKFFVSNYQILKGSQILNFSSSTIYRFEDAQSLRFYGGGRGPAGSQGRHRFFQSNIGNMNE